MTNKKLFWNLARVLLFVWLVTARFAIATPHSENTPASPEYQKGYECGVIIAKLNILTDNGAGEYLRLSNKYFDLNCKGPEQDGIDTAEYIETM